MKYDYYRGQKSKQCNRIMPIFAVGHYLPEESHGKDEFSMRLVGFYEHGFSFDFFLKKLLGVYERRLKDDIKFDFICICPSHGKGKFNPNMEKLAIAFSQNTDIPYKKQTFHIKAAKLAKATQIKAALELGKRMHMEDGKNFCKIRSANDAGMYAIAKFGPQLSYSSKEHFCAIFLNKRNGVIGEKIFTIGTSGGANVNPREVLKEAIELDASAMILVHNHPTGEVSPSDEDMSITENFKKAAALFDIRILDHIIIGRDSNKYYSLSKGKALL